MGKIHFIGGEKGGVGKSVVARLLAQYFIDKDLPFEAFDADRTHGALLRFYPQHATPLAIDNPESLDTLVDVAAEQPDSRVLLDLAAQTHSAISQWIAESGALEVMQECKLTPVFWHVMDDGRDSVDLLAKVLAYYEKRIEYVIVLNNGRGEDFSMFEQSAARRVALEHGAKVMRLARLQPSVMRNIDRLTMNFGAATTDYADPETGERLRVMGRQRVKIWLHHAYLVLDQLGL